MRLRTPRYRMHAARRVHAHRRRVLELVEVGRVANGAQHDPRERGRHDPARLDRRRASRRRANAPTQPGSSRNRSRSKARTGPTSSTCRRRTRAPSAFRSSSTSTASGQRGAADALRQLQAEADQRLPDRRARRPGHWRRPALQPDNEAGLQNDIAMVESLLTHIEGTFCVDPTRVYSTGMSDGGAMTSVLVCIAPDKFAAFAPVRSSSTAGPQSRGPCRSCRSTAPRIPSSPTTGARCTAAVARS